MAGLAEERGRCLLPCSVISTLAGAVALLVRLGTLGLLAGTRLASGHTMTAWAYARDAGHVSTSR